MIDKIPISNNSNQNNVQSIQPKSVANSRSSSPTNIPNTPDFPKNISPNIPNTEKSKEVDLNEYLGKNISATYDFGDNGELRSVKFIDQATKEVLRQIPTEEAIRVKERIDAYLQSQGQQPYDNSKKPNAKTDFNIGLLLDKKV